jgi:hypothetical protein
MPVADLARMLETHPRASAADQAALTACIDACRRCAQACTLCADACLSEDGHQEHLIRCIRLNLDCADVCESTGRVVTRQTDEPTLTRAVLESCIAACRACADECRQHASDMEHCAICSEACTRCAEACESLVQTMG